jgi:hypothetical protein
MAHGVLFRPIIPGLRYVFPLQEWYIPGELYVRKHAPINRQTFQLGDWFGDQIGSLSSCAEVAVTNSSTPNALAQPGDQ